jgi:CHAD domain-containing protein
MSRPERKFDPARVGGTIAHLVAKSLAPVRASDPALDPDDDAQTAFKAIARAALGQIAANARVLGRVRRIEALHQLRVGARRLRSAIALFAPMLADDQTRVVKAELKWLTGELDDARDLDVFIAESFRPAARRHADWTGLAALGRALITAQAHAYDRAEAALGSARFGALMIEVADWIATGPWTTADDPAQAAWRARPALDAASDILGRRRKKILKRGRKLATLSPHALHELRIDAKKLRYACGFFAGLYGGKRQARFVEAMQDLQDGLGALTDIAAGAGLVAALVGAEASGSAGADLAFAAGLVAGERQGRAPKAIKAARAAFSRFEGADRFW